MTLPPVPTDRPGKYRWIHDLVATGFKVSKACELAGVPESTYYHIGKKQIKRHAEGQGAAE